MGVISAVMADQMRMPRGPLARLAARTLNERNRPLIARTVAALGVAPGDRVLDIGFGGAASLELLSTKVGDGQAVGIDPSRALINRARRVLAGHISEARVSVVRGSAEAIPFPEGHFDAVLACQSVYFWSPLRAGLAEVRRVLAPGGRLAIAMMPLPEQEQYGFDRRGYALSHEDLMAHLEGAGFDAVRRWPPGVPEPRRIVVATRL